jgi:hypothetical protein
MVLLVVGQPLMVEGGEKEELRRREESSLREVNSLKRGEGSRAAVPGWRLRLVVPGAGVDTANTSGLAVSGTWFSCQAFARRHLCGCSG